MFKRIMPVAAPLDSQQFIDAAIMEYIGGLAGPGGDSSGPGDDQQP